MPRWLRTGFRLGLVAATICGSGCQAILGIGETNLAEDASVSMPDAVPMAGPDATPDAAAVDAAVNDTAVVDITTIDVPTIDAGPGVTVTPLNRAWVIRGQSAELGFMITRTGGFAGSVDVTLLDLPNAKLGATTFSAAAGVLTGQIEITAASNADLGTFTVQLVGTASVPSTATPLPLEVADPPGTPDVTFGNDGIAFLACDQTCSANAVTVQPDGRVVIAGTDAFGNWLLERFSAQGLVDAHYTPGTPGNLYTVALVGDGRILAGGMSTGGAIARFASDLSLDGTFGNGMGGGGISLHGDTTRPVSSIAITPGGKIAFVTAPSVGSAAVCRIDSEGRTLDPAFNGGACVTPSSASSSLTSLAIATDSTMTMVGNRLPNVIPMNTAFMVAQVDDTGKPVAGFGNGGVEFLTPLASSWATGVAYSQGLPLVVGYGNPDNQPSRYLAVRLGATGMPDPGFAGGFFSGAFFAGQTSQVLGVVVQSDGMVVGAGFSSTGGNYEVGAVVRFTAEGLPDDNFGASGFVLIDIDGMDDVELTSIALAPDGRIVVAGELFGNTPGIVVARFWP